MGRLASMATFVAVIFGILGGIHYYLWARLIRDTGLGAPWRQLGTAALILLGAGMPLAIALGRNLPRGAHRILAWPAFVWMGLMFILFVLLAAGDLARLAHGLAARLA